MSKISIAFLSNRHLSIFCGVGGPWVVGNKVHWYTSSCFNNNWGISSQKHQSHLTCLSTTSDYTSLTSTFQGVAALPSNLSCPVSSALSLHAASRVAAH